FSANIPSEAESLCSLQKYPEAEEQEGFTRSELQAVYFEGLPLRGNHFAVLATYVYGDMEKRAVRVLQSARATFLLNGMTGRGQERGCIRAWTAEEFASKPNAIAMLEQARAGAMEKAEMRSEK